MIIGCGLLNLVKLTTKNYRLKRSSEVSDCNIILDLVPCLGEVFGGRFFIYLAGRNYFQSTCLTYVLWQGDLEKSQ